MSLAIFNTLSWGEVYTNDGVVKADRLMLTLWGILVSTAAWLAGWLPACLPTCSQQTSRVGMVWTCGGWEQCVVCSLGCGCASSLGLLLSCCTVHASCLSHELPAACFSVAPVPCPPTY